jgi:hypothetical protein
MYFNNQWNRGDDFTNWKVFNSAPGVANTNNALESFNNLIKRNYTFHVRHTLDFYITNQSYRLPD